MTIDTRTGHLVFYDCPSCGDNVRGLVNGRCSECNSDEHRKVLSRKRFEALAKMGDVPWMCLTEAEQWDVIEGRAKLSSYQNVPILDYASPLKS
jgi:hypothetical protein